MPSDEIFETVDENNHVTGTAKRSECHGNPGLIHRTAHVVVYSEDGKILFQKRSRFKDIQPGRWDTAVGGHLMPGEDFETAARREMAEEIGIKKHLPLSFLFDMKIRNNIESENVRVFSTISSGPFSFPEEEIDELKFWTVPDILNELENNTGTFTPNLIGELKKLLL